MGSKLPSFRFEPDALHEPFMFRLHVKQSLHGRNARNHGPRLAPAKRSKALHVQVKGPPFDAAKHGGDLVRD